MNKIILGIVAAVFVLIIIAAVGLFVFLSPPSFSISDDERGIPDKGIDILKMPLSASPEEKFEVEFRVIDSKVKKAEVHFSLDPMGDGKKYDNVMEAKLVKGKYTAEVPAPTKGAVFMKFYSTDGKNEYWSEEIKVEVVE